MATFYTITGRNLVLKCSINILIQPCLFIHLRSDKRAIAMRNLELYLRQIGFRFGG